MEQDEFILLISSAFAWPGSICSTAGSDDTMVRL